MLTNVQRNQASRFLMDDDATGAALLVLALDHFVSAAAEHLQNGAPAEAVDPLSWLPETWHRELVDDFGGITPDNFNKLMAALNIHVSDGYFTNLRDWVVLTTALLDGDVDWEGPDLPEAETFLPAVYEAMLIHPYTAQGDSTELFGAEVSAYMNARLNEDGSSLDLDQLLSKHDTPSASVKKRRDWVAREHDQEAAQQFMQRTEEVSQQLLSLAGDHVRLIFCQLKMLPLRSGSVEDILFPAESSSSVNSRQTPLGV